MIWFQNTVDKTNEYVGRAASFLILISVGVTLLEVVLRYAFDAPTIWVNETVLILFGFYFVLGGGYTLRYGGHVRVDILLTLVSERVKWLLNIFASIAGILYLLVLLWISGGQALESIALLERAESSWGPYIFPVLSAVPIAAILMLLQSVANIIRDVTGGPTPETQSLH